MTGLSPSIVLNQTSLGAHPVLARSVEVFVE
jgi:hypothetical protein